MNLPQPHSITHAMFLIFVGTATLATMALMTRQSLLVAYIALGAILGPWGLQLINNDVFIRQAGEIGIIFLLFLVGLDLQPQSLFHSLRKMSFVTVSSSIIFFIIGFVISCLFGYNYMAGLVIGIATIFSSTIIGIKLLPTTILHHQHTGELAISILLLQDIVAILAILIVEAIGNKNGGGAQFGLMLSAFPILLTVAYVFQRYVLALLFKKFDTIHEYIFIVSIGWCLCMSELSHFLGLSEEIGAFIGGVALASNPISAYIVTSLKPLRDFFLVLFFFSIGAEFNFGYLSAVLIPACTLAGLILVIKPLVFRWLLRISGEVKHVSWEIGIRLGQLSEFSLLLIYIALETNLLDAVATHMMQAAIIITFIASCYWTVMRYPTPLASTARLRRD